MAEIKFTEKNADREKRLYRLSQVLENDIPNHIGNRFGEGVSNVRMALSPILKESNDWYNKP